MNQLSAVLNGLKRWILLPVYVLILRFVEAISIDGWAHQTLPLRDGIFFHGHFEGLGYETHLMRVTDTLGFTQPESLNVIAWKQDVMIPVSKIRRPHGYRPSLTPAVELTRST